MGVGGKGEKERRGEEEVWLSPNRTRAGQGGRKLREGRGGMREETEAAGVEKGGDPRAQHFPSC